MLFETGRALFIKKLKKYEYEENKQGFDSKI